MKTNNPAKIVPFCMIAVALLTVATLAYYGFTRPSAEYTTGVGAAKGLCKCMGGLEFAHIGDKDMNIVCKNGATMRGILRGVVINNCELPEE